MRQYFSLSRRLPERGRKKRETISETGKLSEQPQLAPTASTVGPCPTIIQTESWLVGCFGFNGPLRQYSSLYRAVSQREGERGEKGQRRVKMSKQPPPAPTASAIGPCPTVIKIVGRPGTGSLPSTIAPPDRPKTESYLAPARRQKESEIRKQVAKYV